MDASYELMLAAIDALRADPAVAGFVSERIYDRAPEQQTGAPDLPYPYITLGPGVSVPDDYDCLDGEGVTLQFDIWSSGGGTAFGSVECRKICGAVKRVLHDSELVLTVNALVSLQWEMTRVLDDPDPAINHGVVQFTATIETP